VVLLEVDFYVLSSNASIYVAWDRIDPAAMFMFLGVYIEELYDISPCYPLKNELTFLSNMSPPSSVSKTRAITMTMEAACSSEMLDDFQRNTRRCIFITTVVRTSNLTYCNILL
jgi:hypothetical protein